MVVGRLCVLGGSGSGPEKLGREHGGVVVAEVEVCQGYIAHTKPLPTRATIGPYA